MIYKESEMYMHSKTLPLTSHKSQTRSQGHHLPMNELLLKDDPTLSPNSQVSAFMTTAAAAKLLGLSMATVQKLVDNNSLKAWKTFGGHRRISLASVLSYQSTNNFSKFSRRAEDTALKMMLVLESENSEQPSPEERLKWDLPLMSSYFDSLMEAMLELATNKYDLLVLQLTSPRNKQEKTLEVLQKLMRSRQTIGHALILTPELDLLEATKLGEVPLSIQIMNQPLSPEWLSAYLSGFKGQQHN